MSSVADETRGGVKLIEIDQGQLQRHVDGVVREAVEETLNALLDAEADALCGAKKYERSPDLGTTGPAATPASSTRRPGRSS
jgi:transposase-like protein